MSTHPASPKGFFQVLAYRGPFDCWGCLCVTVRFTLPGKVLCLGWCFRKKNKIELNEIY